MGVDDTQPLITHLIELRKRLINSILAILVIFLALVYFANDIYQLVSAPLIRQMPVGATMIATDVASPFFTPIKLTFMVSIILSVPVILYQVWAFVAPALYKHERRLVMPLLVSSTLLFYIGMAFAYVWFSDPCGAGRCTGLYRYSQLPRLCDGAVYRLWRLIRGSGGHRAAVLDGRHHAGRSA